MQDNNLFGEDSTPTSPTPMIKEISLRDITQAVDLKEFRKQNHEGKNNCTDLLLPLGTCNRDDSSTSVNNDGFDWTTPQTETAESSSVSLSSETDKGVFSNDLAQYHSNKNGGTHTYSSPVFESNPVLETIDENNTATGHFYDVPSDIREENLTPNGDVVSEEVLPKRKEIKFALEFETSDSAESNEKPARRLSIPDTKLPKESRTFHPRKRQTIHGNRRDRTQSSFNVEKFSKEELLLMWKSSEVELNQKLKAAVKDKQRLETKLSAMKLHMSTAV